MNAFGTQEHAEDDDDDADFDGKVDDIPENYELGDEIGNGYSDAEEVCHNDLQYL